MADDALLGRNLGRYLVESVIGAGGFATVYRATDTVLERPVALKVLDPSAHRNPTVARRFVNEGRSVARLDHPAVVPVYDAGETDGLLWMAMRLVPGLSLDDALSRQRRYGRDDVAAIVDRIAGALDHAHAQGIVHRDVKPSNILLEGSDPARAWLADFGIAATARTAGRYTTGTLGTAAYMAPEQARPSEVGPAADIYSLGCVIYVLLAGRSPFPGDDHVGLLMAHATEPVPPIGDDELDRVMARALAKAPRERPASAGALADELRPVLVGPGASVEPAGYEGDAATAMGETAIHRAAVADIQHDRTLAYGVAPVPDAPAAGMPAPGGPVPGAPGPLSPPPIPGAGPPGSPPGVLAAPPAAGAAGLAAPPAAPGQHAPGGPPGVLAGPPAAGAAGLAVPPAAPGQHALGGPPQGTPGQQPAPGVPGQQAPGQEAPGAPWDGRGAGPPGPAGPAGTPGRPAQAGPGGPWGGQPGAGQPWSGPPGGQPPGGPGGGPVVRDPTLVGKAKRKARWRLAVGGVVLAAAVVAAVVGLTADRDGGSGRLSDAAGISFDLPEGWALGGAEPGQGTVLRDGETVAVYRHQADPGVTDLTGQLAADEDVCAEGPTEVDLGGTPGARCENPGEADDEVFVATVAEGRLWTLSFPEGTASADVDAVIDATAFDQG